MRAVVVDDSFAIRMMLTRELKKLGFDVEAFESGDAALEAMPTRQAPDVFLVDWVMPGTDGLEVVRRLRAEPRFANSFVMMVTSETLDARVKAAYAAGADEYMKKPFSPDALREKLELLGFAWSA